MPGFSIRSGSHAVLFGVEESNTLTDAAPKDRFVFSTTWSNETWNLLARLTQGLDAPGLWWLSGYTAGQTPQPTYEQVSAGHTGHTEAVRVLYDPSQVSYAQLVDYFWRHIDPTVKDQQFCDVGPQYRSGIYWQNEAERATAEASRDALIKSGRFSTIHTELAPSSMFYLAEDYHQDYYKKNELRYSYYRLSCGRDARVKKLWG